ncbi:MAG: flotillin-like FloA family protein, partial [Ignavibacteria bacterium]|nr:flotillin-like FloA family protein [Ignavibacteria bacterium]
MEALTGLSLIIIIAIAFIIILFLYFIPVRLYIAAIASGVKIKIFQDLIGMRLRRVPPSTIVNAMIAAAKAGVAVEMGKLEAHLLAGGNVPNVINALISADKANLGLTFERAAAIDLA